MAKKTSADAQVPDLIDWGIWRLLTHPSMRVTMTELQSSWTLADYMGAHVALDTIDLRDFRASRVGSA